SLGGVAGASWEHGAEGGGGEAVSAFGRKKGGGAPPGDPTSRYPARPSGRRRRVRRGKVGHTKSRTPPAERLAGARTRAPALPGCSRPEKVPSGRPPVVPNFWLHQGLRLQPRPRAPARAKAAPAAFHPRLLPTRPARKVGTSRGHAVTVWSTEPVLVVKLASPP